MEFIKTTQKGLKFLLTMCPDEKNIVNISKPHFNKSSFNFIHKQTLITWGKLGSNRGTRNLLLNFSIKFGVVILQNKIFHPYQFTRRNSVFFSLIKYFPWAFNPASCGMLGYKPTTSGVTKIALSGIKPKFHVFF